MTTLEDALRRIPEQVTLPAGLVEALEGAGRVVESLARANESLARFAILYLDSDYVPDAREVAGAHLSDGKDATNGHCRLQILVNDLVTAPKR